MKNLELKKILTTFISDSEIIIKKAENDLYFVEAECDAVEKEIEKESIYYEIDFRNDLIREAKSILKDIEKEN